MIYEPKAITLKNGTTAIFRSPNMNDARIAKEIGIKQLELEVIDGNDRALHLYEKFGFTTVGNKPNAFLLKDGTMLNEISMIKVL